MNHAWSAILLTFGVLALHSVRIASGCVRLLYSLLQTVWLYMIREDFVCYFDAVCVRGLGNRDKEHGLYQLAAGIGLRMNHSQGDQYTYPSTGFRYLVVTICHRAASLEHCSRMRTLFRDKETNSSRTSCPRKPAPEGFLGSIITLIHNTRVLVCRIAKSKTPMKCRKIKDVRRGAKPLNRIYSLWLAFIHFPQLVTS